MRLSHGCAPTAGDADMVNHAANSVADRAVKRAQRHPAHTVDSVLMKGSSYIGYKSRSHARTSALKFNRASSCKISHRGGGQESSLQRAVTEYMNHYHRNGTIKVSKID